MLHILACTLHSLVKRTRNDETALNYSAQDEVTHAGYLQALDKRVAYFGGYTITGFMLARLIGSASLLFLSKRTLRNTCNETSFAECPEALLTSIFVSDSGVIKCGMLLTMLNTVVLDSHGRVSLYL